MSDPFSSPPPNEDDADFQASELDFDAIDRDLDMANWNQLSELGNLAIQQQLIIGHGFFQGQYEILRPGKALLMSPDEAFTYLQTLIRTGNYPPDPQSASSDAPRQ